MAQTFEVVEDETVVQLPKQEPDRQAATNMLVLALKALSQKAVIAASALVTGGAILSVWLLWYFVLPASPTVQQLAGVSIYSAFILAIEWIRRR